MPAPRDVPAIGVTNQGRVISAAAAQLALSVTAGPPGTHVTVTGINFPPNEIVALYIDSPQPYLAQPGPRADSSGGFVESITMPGKDYDESGRIDPSRVGPHQICGDTGYPGSSQPVVATACATFTVEPGPSLSPTPVPISQPGASPTLPVPAVLAAFGVLLVIVGGIAFLTRKPSA